MLYKYAVIYNIWCYRKLETEEWELVYPERPDDSKLSKEEYQIMLDGFHRHRKLRTLQAAGIFP